MRKGGSLGVKGAGRRPGGRLDQDRRMGWRGCVRGLEHQSKAGVPQPLSRTSHPLVCPEDSLPRTLQCPWWCPGGTGAGWPHLPAGQVGAGARVTVATASLLLMAVAPTWAERGDWRALYFNDPFICSWGPLQACLNYGSQHPGLLNAVLQLDGIQNRGIKVICPDCTAELGRLPSPGAGTGWPASASACLLSPLVGSPSRRATGLSGGLGNPRCPLLASKQPTGEPGREHFPGRGAAESRVALWAWNPHSHRACWVPQGCGWPGTSGDWTQQG